MINAKIDPLDKVFVKSGELNKNLLADILIKYLRIDEKGNIFPLSNFYLETNKNKVILILLAKKAIYLKLGDNDATSPKELSRLLDMPDGSLRPTLRQLVEEHIAEEENSRYKIFSHALERCADLLKEKPQEQKSMQIEKKLKNKKISMREAIEELINNKTLRESKTASEIYSLIKNRRPGTTYPALYKVLLDMVQQHKLDREIKENTWCYMEARI